ncbi:MAG: DMT family transporter [Candidatus Caldatribacteriaceae bacterium]
MRKEALFADLALLGVNAIWGATFVTMKNLLNEVHPLSILFWRFLIAFLVLWNLSRFRGWEKKTFKEGVILGCALFGGYLFQTLGLVYVTPARSAFLTGLSTIIIPFFALFILRTKIGRLLPLSIVTALGGLALLSFNGGQGGSAILWGDMLTVFGATAYALQIVLVEKFAHQNATLSLVTVEMGTVTALSLFFGLPFILKIPREPGIWGSLFFLGFFATALSFTVQKIAQRYTSSVHVGVIFVSEPVFAALFSYFLWQERLTPQNILGCGLVLLGILIAQLGQS